MASMSKLFVVLLFQFYCLCYGYNVLVVFPEPTKSHGFLGDGYVRHLLEAGHKVTYVTPFPWKVVPENLTQIDISSNLEESVEVFKKVARDYSETEKYLLMLSYHLGAKVVTHPAVKEFLRSTKSKFDVVIAEWIDSELYSCFAAYFKCPLIWSIPTQLYWQPLRIMDEVPNPSYSTDVNSGQLPPLNFWQRLYELWIQVRKCWIIKYTIQSLEEELYHNTFEAAAAENSIVNLPAYAEVPHMYSMMLVNTHPSVATAWRFPPSVKEIAGYHIKLPPPKLDKTLEHILNSSSNGVIFFCTGTTVLGRSLSPEVIADLLIVFGELKQTVLWKIEIPLNNVPPNVHLLKWAPQTSILSHPNTKIFISHAGWLSTIEAVHFGIPLIVTPRNGDQFTNAKSMVKKGVAIYVDHTLNFPKNLRTALKIMLNDSKYQENMRLVSAAYHHRLAPPGKELVHWVEHVVKTRGARHLRSPALNVPLYQKLFLDLAGVITCVIVAIITLVIVIRCYVTSLK